MATEPGDSPIIPPHKHGRQTPDDSPPMDSTNTLGRLDDAPDSINLEQTVDDPERRANNDKPVARQNVTDGTREAGD